jgi:DNA gyrase inhibitor GyrI
MALTVTAAGCLSMVGQPGEKSFEVRRTEESVVLYTIYRGPLEPVNAVNATVQQLMMMAIQRGLKPKTIITFMYLNNPDMTPSAHWLTEIRIPVSDNALKVAGTFGPFTDVKKLAPVDVVVAIKPEGMADPMPVYRKLFPWLLAHNYLPLEGASETFLTNTQTNDYSKMKTQIQIPVRKLPRIG